MTIESDIESFLKTEPSIGKINFDFGGYKVYPSAYSTDMASIIAKKRIQIKLVTLSAGVGASYIHGGDELHLDTSFSIANFGDQSYVIHELAHAHLDHQALGFVSINIVEAIGYLAEAVFREANGKGPMSSHKIRTEAHRIAKTVLGGTYVVSAADQTSLRKEIWSHPHYGIKIWPFYHMAGIKR